MSIQYRSHDQFGLKRHSTIKTGTYQTLFQYLLDPSDIFDDVFTWSNFGLKELNR